MLGDARAGLQHVPGVNERVAKCFRYGVGGPAVPPILGLDVPRQDGLSPPHNLAMEFQCGSVSGSWRDGAQIRLPLRTNAALFDASAWSTFAPIPIPST